MKKRMRRVRRNITFWLAMAADIVITLALFAAGGFAIFAGMFIWFQMSMPDWVAFTIQAGGIALMMLAEGRPLIVTAIAERRAEKARKARIARRNRMRAIEAQKRKEEEKTDSLID